MLEKHKSFIKRHMQELILKGNHAEEAILKSYSILNSADETKKAIKIYETNRSLTNTLFETGVIKLDKSLLKAIVEKEGKEESESLKSNDVVHNFLETEQTIDEIFSLLKTKLRIGLSYALWLSALATIIFTLISRKVMPQFKELFENFGAELPAFTILALEWQDSLFPPSVLGFTFTLSIAYLLFLTKNLSSITKNQSITAKLPFIKNVINYIKCIYWLSHLEALSKLGYSLKDTLSRLSEIPKDFEVHAPNLMEELLAADKIENLPTEFEHQRHHLNQCAEKIITNITRRILGLVMSLIVSYIVFSIMASYLPIFQVGAII